MFYQDRRAACGPDRSNPYSGITGCGISTSCSECVASLCHHCYVFFIKIVTHEWYEVVFWSTELFTLQSVLEKSFGTSCVLIWTDQLSACTKGFSKRVRSGTSSKRWSVYGSPWVNQDWLRMSRWCAGCSHVYVKSHLSLMGQTPVGSQRSFLPSSWHFLIATLCYGSAERKHNTKTPLETNKSFRDTVYECAILSCV